MGNFAGWTLFAGSGHCAVTVRSLKRYSRELYHAACTVTEEVDTCCIGVVLVDMHPAECYSYCNSFLLLLERWMVPLGW